MSKKQASEFVGAIGGKKLRKISLDVIKQQEPGRLRDFQSDRAPDEEG